MTSRFQLPDLMKDILEETSDQWDLKQASYRKYHARRWCTPGVYVELTAVEVYPRLSRKKFCLWTDQIASSSFQLG